MQEGNWVLMPMMMMMMVVVAVKRKEMKREAAVIEKNAHVNEIAQLITSIQSNKNCIHRFPMSNERYMASNVCGGVIPMRYFIYNAYIR